MNCLLVKNMFGVRSRINQQILRWQRSAVVCPQRYCSVKATELSSSVALPQSKKTEKTEKATKLANGPNLKDFLIAGKNLPVNRGGTDIGAVPYFDSIDVSGRGRSVFFEVYGCQMNVNDTEIVWSILKSNGYVKADDVSKADVVLLITCAIREKAESKVKLDSKRRSTQHTINGFSSIADMEPIG